MKETVAHLEAEGKEPEEREKCIIWCREGITAGEMPVRFGRETILAFQEY